MVANRPKITLKLRLFMVITILLAAAFLPVAIVLFMGMLPTFASLLSDSSRDKTRTLTVGLLNFVGCFPFLMMAAIEYRTIDGAFALLTDPLNLCIMYAGATAGYFLDWTMAGISNIVMTTRAKQRQESISKRQEDLVRRWGREVTGDIPLDPEGFPLIEPDKDE